MVERYNMNIAARIQLDFHQAALVERLLKHHVHMFLKEDTCRACDSFLGTVVKKGYKLKGRHMEGCPVEIAQNILRLIVEPEPTKVRDVVIQQVGAWIKERKEKAI